MLCRHIVLFNNNRYKHALMTQLQDIAPPKGVPRDKDNAPLATHNGHQGHRSDT